MYKGYLFGMKLFSKLIQQNKSVMNYEIYNYLKYYKSHGSTILEEDKAIYDLLNNIYVE